MFEHFTDWAREATLFTRFTDRARKVMQLANQEAQRLDHEHLGTEHLLLGLVKEGSGVAAAVLKDLGIDLQALRLEVEKLVRSRPDQVTMGRLPQTPRAKKAVEHAIAEARNLGHNYVGTEHLLLGLLREGDGAGAEVLRRLGLHQEGLRAVVLDYLNGGPYLRPKRTPQAWLLGFGDPADCWAETSPFLEQERRLRTLEGQLRNVRVVLSLLVGVAAGAVLGGEPGAFAGLLLGTLVGILGGRGLGALVAAVPGALLVMAYLPGAGWGLIGLMGGAVVGALLGDLGPPLRLRLAGRQRNRLGVGPAQDVYLNYFARQVMARADREAERFNHEYLGTEHLLLGVLRDDSGKVPGILHNLGVPPTRVRVEVEKIVSSGPGMIVVGKRPQTPRARKVIEHADMEARRLGLDCVGPEHLLLGLVLEEDALAGQILMNLGIKADDVRQQILAPHRRRPETRPAPGEQIDASRWPAEARRTLEELDTQIEQLTREKEAAVRACEFELAAHLRDEAERLKEQRLQLLRDAQRA
jgi:ATP-dependent Clp protease ATP-binding subunit ClpA